MSRTPKRSKGPGFEFWGKRSAIPGAGKSSRCPGRYTKKVTHRAERRQGKKQCNDQE